MKLKTGFPNPKGCQTRQENLFFLHKPLNPQ
jgi:hypothetical protein